MEGDTPVNSEIHLSNADMRYWINEFPILEKIETEVRNQYIPMSTVIPSTHFLKKVALEVYLHKDAGNYALLGLEYLANKSGALNVEIQYVTKNKIHYSGNLNKYNDYKYLGLPEECLDIILETVGNNRNISGGTLKIPIAANCEIGSSPLVFSKVTSLLLELICNQDGRPNYDLLIKELFPKYFLTATK